DAVAQTQHRLKSAELENQAKELEIKQKELETQALQLDNEQSRQIEAQRAELERQWSLIEIEKQQIDLERQRLELQKTRLELETKRIDFAIETASKMIDILQPGADPQTKAMLQQTLIPNLLQLGNGKGVELALPMSKTNLAETITTEGK